MEIDMDKKTLSFRKNGVEEGVAFENIEAEEVFPICLTYRAGIEVRLHSMKVKDDEKMADVFAMKNQKMNSEVFMKLEASKLNCQGEGVVHDGCSFTHGGGWWGAKDAVEILGLNLGWLDNVVSESCGGWLSAVAKRGYDDASHVWSVHLRSIHAPSSSSSVIAVGICAKSMSLERLDLTGHLGLLDMSCAVMGNGDLYCAAVKIRSNFFGKKFRHLKDNDVLKVSHKHTRATFLPHSKLTLLHTLGADYLRFGR